MTMLLLVVMVIVCSSVSSVGRSGEVYIERDSSGRAIELVHNGPSSEIVAFLRDNAGTDQIQTIERVRLLQHKVDVAEIESLSVLKSLQHLELGDYPDSVSFEPGALSRVGKLRTIKYLYIYGTGEKNSFDWLVSLPELQSLTLSSTELYSDEILPRIGQLPRLSQLTLYCGFSIVAFDWLKPATKLQRLELHANGQIATDFACFEGLNDLTFLSFSGYSFADSDIRKLSKYVGQQLEFLSIYVDGDCTIEALSDFRKLRKLVAHCNVGDCHEQRIVDSTLVLSP